MFRKILFSSAAVLSTLAATTTQAGDNFAFGLNLGGGYPAYQPAPVVVNPYPTVYGPSYGYGYGAPTYVAPRYVAPAPSIGFGYSNWNYRPQNYGRQNGYFRGPVNHHGHHHGCR